MSYNDSEPRDEQGRWAAEGSGGSGEAVPAAPKPKLDPETKTMDRAEFGTHILNLGDALAKIEDTRDFAEQHYKVMQRAGKAYPGGAAGAKQTLDAMNAKVKQATDKLEHHQAEYRRRYPGS